MTERQASIGLDVGGTKIATGLMDANGRIFERLNVGTVAAEGGHAVLRQILSVVETLHRRAQDEGYTVNGVGIACPGVIDLRTVTVTYASNNIPGWTGTPLGPAIRERCGLPAWADNDGNIALVGELQFGAGRGEQNALMITLGTGVGGSVAVNGRILRGAGGSAGKFGHIPVSQSGPVCSCGRRGCVEAYASGPSVVRAAATAFGFAGSAEDLVALARQGHPESLRSLKLAGQRLGMAIAAAANLLDPGLCLISGGLAAAGDVLLGPARHTMASKCHPSIVHRTRLELAALGPDAGLLGAAYLPWNPRVLGASDSK